MKRKSDKICILVANEVTSDPRVTKEAKTLSDAGYNVCVVGLKAKGMLPREIKDGYKIIRLPKTGRKSRRGFFSLRTVKLLLKKVPFLEKIVYNHYFRISITFKPGTFIRDHYFILKSKYPNLSMKIEFLYSLKLLFTRMSIFLSSAKFGKFQYYHANDLDTLIPTYLLARKNKSHLIYDAHEIYPHQIPGRGKLATWILEQIERLFITKADAVITVNKQIAQHFKNTYSLKKIPYVLTNCPEFATLDKDRIYSERQKLQRRLNLNNVTKIALYHGKFAIQRGIEALIDASHFFSNDLILIIRGPDSDYKNLLLDYAQKQEVLNTKVFFDEPVPMEKIILAASAADIGILNFQPLSLNNHYILPNKLFEYMTAGLAIVSSNLPAPREIISKWHVGVLFPNNKPAEIANVLNHIANNDNTLSEFKYNSYQVAKEVFNWQIEGKKLLEIYSSLRRKSL